MAFCAQCERQTPSPSNFCESCGAEFSLDRASLIRHWVFLGLALVWSAVALFVCFGYHLPESSGVLSITTNGHTYFGHPPALTLYQRDPVSVFNILVALSTGLLVATVDLVLRVIQRSERFGGGAVIVGAMVALFSLFGLLYGVASIGVVGVLLILSGQPLKKSSKHQVSENVVS